MPKTRAQENRAIRQQALRDQLANQGHVQDVVEIARQLGEPTMEPRDVARLKAKADIHLALIKKYIPDLKAIELSSDPDRPIENKWTVEFINATPDTDAPSSD